MAPTLTAGDETPPPQQISPHEPHAQTQRSSHPEHPSPSQPEPRQIPLPQPPGQVPLRADSPESLLVIVPVLLGFNPEASLVVIGTEAHHGTVKVTLRYDLPDPPGFGAASDVAAHAIGVLGAQALTAVVAVGYGAPNLVDPMAEALRDAARDAGIEVLEFLRVQDGHYRSYMCGDEACCPAAGVPLDASATAAAEAAAAATRKAAVAGAAVLPDRAAVAARVAPLGGIAAESMRQATRRAERHVTQLLAKVRKSARIGAGRRMLTAEGLAAVSDLIAAYRSGGTFTADYQVAWVTVALQDLRVRDDAWARMDPANVGAHCQLWTDVTRRAQPGYVAAPAALLAFVAWQSGDGALANVALDRALADDPRYSMALLLRQVITAGAPPSLARLPMTPEEVAASYDEADEVLDEYDHDSDQCVHDPNYDDEL